MKITSDAITAVSVRALRVDIAKASQSAFDLQLKIERSEITPEAAAEKLAEILAPLQIEAAPEATPASRATSETGIFASCWRPSSYSGRSPEPSPTF